MSEQTMEIAKKEKPKPRKINISERNLTKSFRELLEETRSRNTTICIKILKMGIDMVKQKKVFQKICKLRKSFQS